VLRDDWRSDFAALLTKSGGFMVSLIAFDLFAKNARVGDAKGGRRWWDPARATCRLTEGAGRPRY
jgi:hypothetical protein